MATRKLLSAALATLLVAGCADTAEPDRDLLHLPAEPDPDTLPGGLYHDFLDEQKLDAAGHPQGARVFEGESDCEPETGVVGRTVGDVIGIAAEVDRDSAGALCRATTRSLGDGTFTLNARALMVAPDELTEDAVLEINVWDGDRNIASRSLTAADFGEEGAERDLAVTFRHRGDGAVRFEVEWTGAASARLSYVELFRSSPRLVISPPSRVLPGDEEPMFEIEMQNPPDDLTFEVECDGADLTPVLTELLEEGDATWEETEFRTLVKAPARRLFETCEPPGKVRVRAMAHGYERETSRVTYLADPIPCAYAPTGADPDLTRVLVTGFEPFPADSNRDNSSKEAVDAYMEGPRSQGIAVMRAVLPVEYDSAPALLQDVVDRCDPDVVVSFGQGRSEVDVETTAYNRKDTASVFGGVPDNRGVVYGGAPIVEDGPAEMQTGLPVDAILAELDALGIDAGPSDDPGRYICNNVFYSIMDIVERQPARNGGFVHLPRIPSVDDTDREMLRKTVATVVDAAVRRGR